jgi:small GTP-binding protein
MSEENKPINIKVVLIGEAGVGKTSIIMRYITNIFNPRQLATQGASYVSKIVEINKNQKVKFELWDTAGEEKYRAIARVFYQNASVCILVYDITRKSSFDEIKNFWVNEIKQNIQDDASKIIFIYK